ncbi:MAG: glutamate--tRNA ligase [Candidatus Eisenbacteria bacterium]|uniref:Glutamate--tRNA ligase n=1 Tax=Eiseniibacteriota bacterium TaxID=2212470 RepID=A0A849SJ07_UNCEI|nr:glutamate--tRNA ligase [Candidatus Eisenbacteria bacterium]
MSVRVRFAPSPTGTLHVGGARTALYNYLFARANGGRFILRIEDTDTARSTDDSVQAIFAGLRWLGLEWDEGPGAEGAHGPYFQSERRERYQHHLRTLEASSAVYPCFCSPEELEARRAEQLAGGAGPRYDGRCRRLSAPERAEALASRRPAAWRFATPTDGETAWDDVLRDRVEFRNEVLEDFVVMRSDGLPTYNYACVVDDHEMEITHVVRGDDHISNTPRQRLLYDAFGWTAPQFAHVPMILGADGSRLSKRHGATSVGAYAELGMIPEAMVNFLALLGWSYDGERELFTLAELEQLFRLERVGKNPAIFDLQKLEWMNGQHLKRLSEPDRVERVTQFLAQSGHDLSARTPEWRLTLVRAIGDRLKTLADARRYAAFCLEDPLVRDESAWTPVLERPKIGPRLREMSLRIEADGEFSLTSLEAAIRSLAAERGLKLGDLIGAARIALTGGQVSPGFFEVVWLLGRDRAVTRLREAAGEWERNSPLAAAGS